MRIILLAAVMLFSCDTGFDGCQCTPDGCGNNSQLAEESCGESRNVCKTDGVFSDIGDCDFVYEFCMECYEYGLPGSANASCHRLTGC